MLTPCEVPTPSPYTSVKSRKSQSLSAPSCASCNINCKKPCKYCLVPIILSTHMLNLVHGQCPLLLLYHFTYSFTSPYYWELIIFYSTYTILSFSTPQHLPSIC